ncbi:MAG: DEAD/DEAH box helicase [Micrococcaceae bacterium]
MVSTKTDNLTSFQLLNEFIGTLKFPLDNFQLEACKVIENGAGVLVAAPTGAGKTIVGEFAMFVALKHGKKAFYTAPIKALSNQKYLELSNKYGKSNVGLLTGDTNINSEAPLVVMTTEVLRNMIYTDSSTLDELQFVIMDEVHYLADRNRGAVWEEVILHLPQEVKLVSLSATVSNAEEFGQWLELVRGDTKVIVTEHRPVPLWQHVMVDGKIYDLYQDISFDVLAAKQNKEKYRVNPKLLQIRRELIARYPKSRRAQGRNRRNFGPKTSRFQVLESLASENLLPAIYFIFSRKGCDAAVAQILASPLKFTNEREEELIDNAISAAIVGIPQTDLDMLGFRQFRQGLLRGVAAHHAGVLPVFKELVEKLFSLGLVKAVFATETLALGVNMPAKTVVLEKLDKYNGTTHVDITAGEYTQLTGRAGRRSIDIEGHAVVLWQADTDPYALGRLASKRSYPLNSSFKPSYNMAVNLIEAKGIKEAKEVLELSFAQFQDDKAVVGVAKKVHSLEGTLAAYQKNLSCENGDFEHYYALYNELQALKRKVPALRRLLVGKEAVNLASYKPGDVVKLANKEYGYKATIIRVYKNDATGTRLLVLTEKGKVVKLAKSTDIAEIDTLGYLQIPKKFNVRIPKHQSKLLSALHKVQPKKKRKINSKTQTAQLKRAEDLQEMLENHPCRKCPELKKHLRWARRAQSVNKDLSRLKHQIKGRTNNIASIFDRVCKVLLETGYLNNEDSLKLTSKGKDLQVIYGENDLLLTQSIHNGIFDDLNTAALAALVSCCIYEPRKNENNENIYFPSEKLSKAYNQLVSYWSFIDDLEQSNRIKQTREPDPGFMWPTYFWAKGAPMEEALENTELTGGDFVRNIKQVIDVLAQFAGLRDRYPFLANKARNAVSMLKRGVVVYEPEEIAESNPKTS